ncbi:ABC transporter permease [Paraburkholderia sp. GAS348]|uniref:ABC transporter permease n=1 Tax=Paraburkholderia sp. GAS348 TaxID=3035132 RepID=UPI003D1F880B
MNHQSTMQHPALEKTLSRLFPAGRPYMLLLPAALLVTVFLWIPVAGTLLDSVHSSAGWSLRAYEELLGGAFRHIFFSTVVNSVWVTLGCLCLGVPTSYCMARINRPWLLTLTVLAVTGPFFVSALIRSYSWVVVLGNNGLVNGALLSLHLIDQPVRLAYTHLGMIVAMVQVELPLFILPAYSVMRRVPPDLRRSAQSLGSDPVTAFLTVFLPLAAPGVIAGCALVFMTSLGFYETPALLGPPGTYFLSQAIEVRVNSLADQSGAAAHAVVLLVLVGGLTSACMSPLLLALSSTSAQQSVSPSSGLKSGMQRFYGAVAHSIERVVRRLARFRWPIAISIASFTFMLLIVPLLILFPLAFSSAPFVSFPPPGLSAKWFTSYLSSAQWVDSTLQSLFIGLTSAALATVAGGLAVLGGARLSAKLRFAVFVNGAVPLVISPIVMAVAMFYLAARLGLIGSPLAFISAYAVMGLPYPIFVIGAALTRLDPSLSRAATSLGATAPVVLRTVIVPLLGAAILSGFVFAFLIGFNDVDVALFLNSSSMKTLPLLMLEDIREEITPRPAAVAVVLIVGTASFFLVCSVMRKIYRKVLDFVRNFY